MSRLYVLTAVGSDIKVEEERMALGVAEFAELLLVRLRQHAGASGFGSPADVREIAREFGVTDDHQIFATITFLAQRELIRDFSTTDSWEATITAKGSIAVERGGDTGILARFRQHPEKFLVNVDNRRVDQSVHFHGNISDSAVAFNSRIGHQQVGKGSDIDTLLDELGRRVAEDRQLSADARREADADIATLRSELRRREKRPAVIKETLSALSNIASIADTVVKITTMLGS